MIQVLIKTVLKNPYIWGMALTYFFIYVIRQGVTSWCVAPSVPPATQLLSCSGHLTGYTSRTHSGDHLYS